MRRKIIAGNWKMNLTVAEGLALAEEVKNRCSRFSNIDVVVGPVATSLYPIAKLLEGSTIGVAAQNCHWAEKGAYTGELSCTQIKEIGCKYVIIGHSERRQYFAETSENVGKKARALHDMGLTPIMCVGETLDEREAGKTFDVIAEQVKLGLAPLTAEEVAKTVIAYEPVWAIGTGRTATPDQAQEVHAAIRNQIAELYGKAIAEEVRIQYGGSVKGSNAPELLTQPDIDGALVGGASLTADAFYAIVAYEEAKK